MGKILLIFLISFMMLLCGASSDKPSTNEAPEMEEQELSLKKDREYLDKIRKDVPEDVKMENDDLAFTLKLFEDKKRNPNKIRRQFDEALRKVRKKKTKEFKKQRKEFTKKEKKDRKGFLKKQKSDRKEMLEKKLSKDDKKEFFDDQKTRRKEYFADLRDKRKDFESEMRARRKEFDDYIKDKRKQFDDLYRSFKKEQKEVKKQEKEAKRKKRTSHNFPPKKSQLSAQHQQYLNDFNKVPKERGIPLEPKKEE